MAAIDEFVTAAADDLCFATHVVPVFFCVGRRQQ
jgi:hypothetical protein